MLPSTTSRVERNTAASVNREIQQRTEENIAYFAENPHKIELRLHELEQEWDIERTLEANASTLNLMGITLAAAGYRRWLWPRAGTWEAMVAVLCLSTRVRRRRWRGIT